MKIEDDIAELKRIECELDKIVSEKMFHKAYMCQEHCPVKIDDIVISNGYTNKGKSMLVDRVMVDSCYQGELKFKASGYVYKKNGDLGVQRADWRGKSS